MGSADESSFDGRRALTGGYLCFRDFWDDIYRKSHRPGNKAKAMGLAVKSESFGSIIASRNLHRRFQHHSDELS